MASNKRVFREWKSADWRKADAWLNAQRRDNIQERQYAQRTLSPAQIREAIRTGDVPPQMEVLIGRKADGTPFTADDMRGFDQSRRHTAKKYGSSRGALIDQLVASSDKADIARAKEISYARLYKVGAGTLTFLVAASPGSEQSHYQVRVRLEGWMSALTSASNYYSAARDLISRGKVSFDCPCGRHQFWYRYIATVGNFALTPYEKDFPKIRNPNLTGCCCKHVIKTLSALKSPTVQATLGQAMEKQAAQISYGGTASGAFLKQDEHKALSRARPKDVDRDAAERALKRIQNAQKGFSESLKDKKMVASLQAQVRNLKQRLAKEKAGRQKAIDAVKKAASKPSKSKDALKVALRAELDRAKLYGSSPEQAYKVFSGMNGMPISQVKALAEDL